MKTSYSPLRRRSLGLTLVTVIAAGTSFLPIHQLLAQPATEVVRLRGTVLGMTPTTLTLKERSGEVVELAMSDKLAISEVFAIRLEDIKPGSYIGTAALPQADGSQQAIAVTVFPETARGLAEGHKPFDLMPQSTMTNATVSDVGAIANTPTGRRLVLKYKDGEKVVIVPANAPVVTWRPGDRALLVPGASVSLSAQLVDGKPTVLRVSAGRDGFVLPY